MLVSQGSQRGVWYHSTGGPTQNKPYAVTIEANKRIDSHGIQSTELIGTILPGDVNKVKAAAQRVPAQQCQRYVVALVHELEKKGFVQHGEAVRLNEKVQMSERAQAYATQNPVEHPSGAYINPGDRSHGSSHGSRRTSPLREQQQTQHQYAQERPQARHPQAHHPQAQHPRAQHPQAQDRRNSKESKSCCVVM